MTTDKHEDNPMVVSPGKARVDMEEGHDASARQPFTPPKMERHEKLPVITAGSLTESHWGF